MPRTAPTPDGDDRSVNGPSVNGHNPLPGPHPLPWSIPFVPPQPRPLAAKFTRDRHADGSWSTSIARVFKPEDTANCRYCPTCSADRSTGMCLVTIHEYVASDKVTTYTIEPEDMLPPEERAARMQAGG